jgi:RNA polymerase sigma-70 factor (ECF subfamily)
MTSPLATDEALLDGLRAGRRDAFERVYGEHNAPIYNLCARILGDREEAKDVTQEVFIKVFDQLPAAEASSFKLRPWLYRVATNACFNHLRTRRHLDGGGDARLENAASGVDEFERAQTVALVKQSLGAMNERYRIALVLKDLQGLPPEEIAEVMEVSRPTADVLVHRARASFKTVFAKLAGEGVTAPAALGLVLLPLTVPAALQAMPPLPAHLAPLQALPHPAIPHAAGPAGAGLLTKIGAALTTKAAITAAAAAVVIAGGVVAVKEAHRDGPAAAAAAASAPAAGGHSRFTAQTSGFGHDGRWAGHRVPNGSCGHGTAAQACDAAGHDSGEHAAAGTHHSASHHAGDGHTSTAAATHDTATHDATTTTSHTADHSTSTTTTTTHDGGDDMSGSHDVQSGE